MLWRSLAQEKHVIYVLVLMICIFIYLSWCIMRLHGIIDHVILDYKHLKQLSPFPTFISISIYVFTIFCSVLQEQTMKYFRLIKSIIPVTIGDNLENTF